MDLELILFEENLISATAQSSTPTDLKPFVDVTGDYKGQL